jgi:hypothetical protein
MPTQTAERTAETVKEKAMQLWKRSEAWGDDAQIEALLITLNAQLADRLTVSMRNYKCVAMQMEEQGLPGEPYLHTRTFNGWKASGRMVRKGEKSSLQSITWIGGDGEDGESRMYPKATYLFHLSQTDGIENFVPSDEPAEKKPYAKRERKPKGITAGLAVVQEGVTVQENAAKGGIEIKFGARPSAEVLAQLKANRFRWSSSNGCWYTKLSDSAKAFAYGLQA